MYVSVWVAEQEQHFPWGFVGFYLLFWVVLFFSG